jgi:nicotinate dehydrogenase subunit A
MAKKLTITVNGRRHAVQAAPATPLLYVLRNELGLHGPRFGCGLSQCGACTVHVGGEAVRSCVVPVSSVASQRVTTLEGLGTEKSPHPLVEAFIAEDAAQCGYCINGMVMQSVAFLRRNPRPTEDQIKKALNANICRCGTHYRIVKAVARGARALAKEA